MLETRIRNSLHDVMSNICRMELGQGGTWKGE
jgi:hypothetical protein